MNLPSSEPVKQQLPQPHSVIGVQPFRRGDKAAGVPRLAELSDLDEKVQMQTSESAAIEAMPGQLFRIPMFPPRFNVVMTDVGWVADKQRRPGPGGQGQLSKVADDHFESAVQASDMSVGADNQSEQRVGLTGDDARRAVSTKRGQGESTAAGTAIYDDARVNDNVFGQIRQVQAG